MLTKIIWVLRSLFVAPFYGSFKLPSYIAKPLFVGNRRRVYVSKRVRILPHSRIEVVSKEASIVFEEDISVGQNFHITSGGNLVIGKKTTIAENVMITNIDHNYQEIGKHILEQSLKIQETRIGDNCFIGFGAVIQAGTVLGKQCVVGANSVVRGHFPDYCVIVGAPGRIVKRYDEKGNMWRKTDSKGSFLGDMI